MKDSFGREIEYLRLSITDKCNLRCSYCMPENGIKYISHNEVLTYEEIIRFVSVLAKMGLKKVRLTGGEALVRRDCELLVKALHSISGIKEVCLTTNGFLLKEKIPLLKEAGLSSVNISLDTLNEKTFEKISPGSSGVSKVLEAVSASLEAGFKVKINCLPLKGVNECELEEIALLAKKYFLDLRFIELMPIGMGKNYTFVPSEKILSDFEKTFGKPQKLLTDEHSPARYYSFNDFKGRLGFISPMSHSFCSYCNRIRLTADGRLKLCLCYEDGLDVKKLLRSNADEQKIKSEVEKVLMLKPPSHGFNKTGAKENRMMAQIGG